MKSCKNDFIYLHEWSCNWQMSLNSSKCKTIGRFRYPSSMTYTDRSCADVISSYADFVSGQLLSVISICTVRMKAALHVHDNV